MKRLKLKRVIASFFTLFACSILVAHNVVPHHHHEHAAIVYLIGSLNTHTHCCQQEESHSMATDYDGDDGDCHNRSTNCIEANIDLKDGGDIKEEHRDAINEIIPLLLFSVVDSNVNLNVRPYSHLFYKPYTLSYYTNYITDSQGLRAPPVC